MCGKLFKEIEIDFLNQLYLHKGAIGSSNLFYIFEESYGLKQDSFNRILNRLVEKEYCIIERIKKLDGSEDDIVFVTEKGLAGLAKKKKIDMKKVLVNRMSYELKCEGCVSFSEWLEKNRQALSLEAEITRMFARALADMGIIIMNKDDGNVIRSTLRASVDRLKGRVDSYPELNSAIEYTVILTIYNKLMELPETDKLITEAENAKKLIEPLMPGRYEEAIGFI